MAPFKSTQSFSVGTFLKTFRNRDAVGPAALNSPVRTETGAPTVKASGGTKVPHNDSPDGRTYHIFTSNANFTVTSTGNTETIEVLLVAGGGGGGKMTGGSLPGGDGGIGGGGGGGSQGGTPPGSGGGSAKNGGETASGTLGGNGGANTGGGGGGGGHPSGPGGNGGEGVVVIRYKFQ